MHKSNATIAITKILIPHQLYLSDAIILFICYSIALVVLHVIISHRLYLSDAILLSIRYSIASVVLHVIVN